MSFVILELNSNFSIEEEVRLFSKFHLFPENPLPQKMGLSPFMKRTPDECRARIERNQSNASHSSNESSLGPSNRVLSLNIERVNRNESWHKKNR